MFVQSLIIGLGRIQGTEVMPTLPKCSRCIRLGTVSCITVRFAGAGHPSVESQLEKMTRATCRLHVRAGVCAPREALTRYSARENALFGAPFPVVCGLVEVRLVVFVVRVRSFASFIGSSLFRLNLCFEHATSRPGCVRISWWCRHQVIAATNFNRQSESNLLGAS